MPTTLLILGLVLFALALWLLFVREAIAPVASLLGLVSIYFSHLLPLASNMVITWTGITLILLGVSVAQPAVMAQKRGMAYMTAGAFVGLAVGLVAALSASLTLRYAAIIIATAAGIFFGLLFYSRTPSGRDISIGSGRFFSYLAAKGFPLAITVIQASVPLLLYLVINES